MGDIRFVSLLLAGLAVAGYFFLWHLPSRRSAREGPRRPLFEARCPVRTGFAWWFYMGGYGRFALYDDFLVAVYLLRNELAYSDIGHAELRRPLLAKGIYLFPRNPGGPRYVAVFPRDPEHVVMLLERRGLTVTRKV